VGGSVRCVKEPGPAPGGGPLPRHNHPAARSLTADGGSLQDAQTQQGQRCAYAKNRKKGQQKENK
ncbi:hypothetical protein, partial [Aeromonas salmonicida]|uniref:hypothetical protein n=1 Tax=Aeromonas salmonicida TaxID=645 RepID=UPI003D310206